jgi:hypothetical protein
MLIIPQKRGWGSNPFILARIPESSKNKPYPDVAKTPGPSEQA